MSACICVRTLHVSCMHASVFAACTVCMHMCSHIACFMPQLPLTLTRPRTVHTIWERTHHTHTQKYLRQYGSELPYNMGTNSPNNPWGWAHQTDDDTVTVLFICFICLFVCWVFYSNDIEAMSDYLDTNNTLSCADGIELQQAQLIRQTSFIGRMACGISVFNRYTDL